MSSHGTRGVLLETIGSVPSGTRSLEAEKKLNSVVKSISALEFTN